MWGGGGGGEWSAAHNCKTNHAISDLLHVLFFAGSWTLKTNHAISNVLQVLFFCRLLDPIFPDFEMSQAVNPFNFVLSTTASDDLVAV